MVSRGGMAESVHAVAACVSDRDGRLAGESSPGAAALEVFVRSAAKPFQALAAVRADALEALGLGDRHLAVACASHDSSEERVLLVQEILATAGLGEDALACGIAAPLDGRVAREIGDDIRPVHHNCSGKHAAMLATCVVNGWPIATYLEPDHPLQRGLKAAFSELTSEPVVSVGVDGCGAPLFSASLTGLARAFSALVLAAAGTAERRVADAIVAAPEFASGSRRDEAALLRAVPGAIGKAGAEACYAVALPDGRAVALKIDDGGRRACPVVMVQALRRLDVDSESGVDAEAMHRIGEVAVLGGGRPVGELRPTF